LTTKCGKIGTLNNFEKGKSRMNEELIAVYKKKTLTYKRWLLAGNILSFAGSFIAGWVLYDLFVALSNPESNPNTIIYYVVLSIVAVVSVVVIIFKNIRLEKALAQHLSEFGTVPYL
jgi:predicted Co/Zn/Cd cation transporter (cation efflux family)